MEINLVAVPNVYIGSNYQVGYDAQSVGTVVAYNAGGALNDEFRWWLPTLSPGTWRLDGLFQRAANQGVMTFDISFDGGANFTPIGVFDGYAAATQRNQAGNWAFVVPAGSQPAILRARVLGKHLNSSGHVMVFTALNLTEIP